MHPLIPQAVGLLAVATYLLSYQMKTRGGIITLNVSARLLYILQYLLLGALAGAVLDVAGVIASLIAAKSEHPFLKKNRTLIIVLTDVMIVASGILVFEDVFSVLPIVAVLLQTGALWMNDERKIRIVSLIAAPFWLAYNIYCIAIGSSIGDVLSMISIITAMIRYRKLRNVEEPEISNEI